MTELDFNIQLFDDPLTELTKDKEKINNAILAKQDEINRLNEQVCKATQSLLDLRNKNRDVDFKIRDEKIRIAEQERIEAERREMMAQVTQFENELSALKELCSDLESFNQAHSYQLEDVNSALIAFKEGKNGLLNANPMGLGKTIETVITLHALWKLIPNAKTLWLTKKSLMKKSTPKEIRRWNPNATFVKPPDVSDASSRDFLLDLYVMQKANIFIANYEFVRTTPKAKDIEWDIVVIDEVHKLKGGANANGPTAIWTAVKDICQKAKFVLMLSGTPMVNNPVEMFSYLHIFHPEKFPDLKTFKRHYTQYKDIAGEMQLVVDSNKLLGQALKGQMIRREAHEVGLQVPDLNYEIIELERTSRQEEVYKQMQNQFFIWLEEQGDKPLSAMAVIAQLTRLRQINVWPADITFKWKENEDDNIIERSQTLDIRESAKIDETLDIIENVQDQIVIFCTLNHAFPEIKRRCKAIGLRCEIISGEIKNDFDPEHEFQQGNIDVLCLNSSMGEGLNLQKNPQAWKGGARYGIMLDRWWSPARNEQCIKRIQRQGSTEPVFMYELQTVPSVDQFIQKKNEDKTESFAGIMDSNEIRPANQWKAYFEGINQKEQD